MKRRRPVRRSVVCSGGDRWLWMSSRTSMLFQQRKEFFEQVHLPPPPPPIFLHFPDTPPGHSSRMSRFDFCAAMETRRGSSAPASAKPPAKPKRTFAHDIYMAEKAAEEKARRDRDCDVLEQRREEEKTNQRNSNRTREERTARNGVEKENVSEGCHFGISATKMISRYEQLSCDSQSAPPQKKFVRDYKRPQKLHYVEEKIVELTPINGNYCTVRVFNEVLEKGAMSPMTPCDSPLLLKSVQESATDGPYFQFRIRRRNCIREKDTAPGNKRAEGDRERARRKDRATVIRQHTLEQIKKQNEELATATKPMLFDTALIVSIERLTGADGSVKQSPNITFSYGQTDNKCTAGISHIIYPDASHAAPLKRGKTLDPSENSFFVALTDETGMRTYAYCIKFEPATSEMEPYFFPCVLALITRIRDPSFYFELARRAILNTDDVSRLKRFLNAVHDKEHPRRGGMLVVEQRDETGGINRRSEICTFGCEPKMRMGWSVNDLVRELTPEWTTCIIAAVLAEQRVLITGSSVHEVTRAVQAIDALLRPFEWPFCFIPCIPDNMFDFCDNPSPYLIGILRHSLDKIKDLVVEDNLGKDDCQKNQSDFALFDINRGLINPIPLTFKNNMHFEEHDAHFSKEDEKERETNLRLKNCYTYCKRVGMPRKVAKNLVQLLYKGLEKDKGTFSVETCTEAMLTWYATIFGHYKSSGATSQWDKISKTALVEKQAQPSRRDYLEYLVESAMFNLWIERRVTGYNVAKILGDTTRDMVRFMQNVLVYLEITTISDPAPGFLRLWQLKIGDRLVCPEEELEVIDAIFEKISDAQNYKRKKPVKHAFGKLFGSSRRVV